MDDDKATPAPRVRQLGARDAAITLLDRHHLSILGISDNSVHRLFFELSASLIPLDQLRSCFITVKSNPPAPKTVYWESASVSSEPAVIFLFVDDRLENHALLEHPLRVLFPNLVPELPRFHTNPPDTARTVLTLPPANNLYGFALAGLEFIAQGHAINASAN